MNIAQYSQLSLDNQLTEQGSLTVEIYVQDTHSGHILGMRVIKRSELAKMFYEQRILGSKNNKFIVGY